MKPGKSQTMPMESFQSNSVSFDENDLPYSETYGDHYFSRHDGRAECCHVFLEGNGLPGRWVGTPNFTIGELGFGTGLNFLVSWDEWKKARQPGQHLIFVSVEAHPLKIDVAARALSQWPELEELKERLLKNWNDLYSPIEMDDQTTLHVRHGEAINEIPHFPFVDAWYLDGFSPAKNKSMWSAELMQQLANHTAPKGTLASYTAAGWVRRNLELAGFEIEKHKGFGTKRHMIKGVKMRDQL